MDTRLHVRAGQYIQWQYSATRLEAGITGLHQEPSQVLVQNCEQWNLGPVYAPIAA